jgi:hypothetical protein
MERRATRWERKGCSGTLLPCGIVGGCGGRGGGGGGDVGVDGVGSMAMEAVGGGMEGMEGMEGIEGEEARKREERLEGMTAGLMSPGLAESGRMEATRVDRITPSLVDLSEGDDSGRSSVSRERQGPSCGNVRNV